VAVVGALTTSRGGGHLVSRLVRIARPAVSCDLPPYNEANIAAAMCFADRRAMNLGVLFLVAVSRTRRADPSPCTLAEFRFIALSLFGVGVE